MDQPPAPSAAADAPRRTGILPAALIVAGLFLVFAVPLILITPAGGRAAADEAEYHLPTVLAFARDWPRFDFRSYTSATTPGYHLVLAAVAKFLSSDIRLLRAVGSLFTVGLLVTIASALTRRIGPRNAVVLCLPLLCSSYVFKAGIWILPENAAWWGLLGTLLIALRAKVDGFMYLAGGCLLAALVFVRQMHLWSAAVLWLAAWLGNEASAPESNRLAAPLAGRFGRAATMFLATLPAFVIVACFVRLWGGMVPEHYRLHGETRTGTVFMDGGNPAAPAMFLSLFAAFGLFFIHFTWGRVVETVQRNRRALAIILLGSLVGLLIGSVPETSYDFAAGRWSGLWNLVNRMPTVANRSPLIVALSTLGGAMVAMWWLVLGHRDRWLFLAMWTVFALAQSFSSMAWQRYYEPFLLMTLALAAARVDAPKSRAALAGPLVLAVLLAGVTIATLR